MSLLVGRDLCDDWAWCDSRAPTSALGLWGTRWGRAPQVRGDVGRAPVPTLHAPWLSFENSSSDTVWSFSTLNKRVLPDSELGQ